ncbi:glucosamine-6-phosphate deaminase [Rhabdobacter roseus]|uniref:Galactosamine-6-phosphate isomerase n=1 Tax=Rhabdobacter roseus TaxID=1655419 RepID=A0A840TTH4_9BACT|nr:glucosamine-6-phosphate deaminase [Rhabdobacter roseus]MBB5286205.1 galactosamine-6-phosphate isomerase [Rhabdobacter roseus]
MESNLITRIFPTYEALSQAAADLVAEALLLKPTLVFCLPSGSTPLGMFQELAERHQRGEVDFFQSTFIGLDEWVGMGPEDEGSCRAYLDRDFLRPVGFRDDQIVYFNAQVPDLPAECERINRALALLDGLDLIVLGVGMNGHLALNEPGTSFDAAAHLSTLHETTIQTGQKYFKEPTTLTQGVTLGLRTILEARQAVLLASGAAKAPVVQRLLAGTVSEAFPASVLHLHPHAQLLLDDEAAALVEK